MNNITKFEKEVYLDKIFPTVIGIADCPFINEVQDEYKQILKSIPNDGEMKYHQIHKDHRFDRLTNWIIDKVYEYSKEHNFPEKYMPYESWCLEYKRGSHNPAHVHTGSIISVSFHLETSIDDVPIAFRGPYFKDMLNPLKLTPQNVGQSHHYNKLTSPAQWYYPLTGRLLIFRSFVEHEVDIKNSDDPRIIISMNFK